MNSDPSFCQKSSVGAGRPEWGADKSAYVDIVLRRFSVQDSKKGSLPMLHGISLSKAQSPSTQEERDRMSRIPYASAIGSIMYVMLCTRPDVSYTLSMTNRYQSDPGERHWIAVKNILKYLQRTKEMFLVYGGEEGLVVRGYTDASFQSDKDDSRSQSGVRNPGLTSDPNKYSCASISFARLSIEEM
ncbi:hypothetical protein CRG98_014979 [Punica granatum]|uniref:Secreted RxLR effector protein 161-like n=1 Tax=Punica granatum TaxID=22663 RepID=A0A2I0K7V5_PUNGR|nr:hypothetical protein CRG98_014979 [Punica granatum]